MVSSDFPWKGRPDETACNLALGNLVRNLPERLKIEGRIHAETFLAASGVIAGFAAQRALFFDIAETNDTETQKEIHVITTRDGRTYYFGEPLNRMLLPQSEADAHMRLWSLAAGAAVASGLSPSQLPELGPMFEHVAGTLGRPDAGMPSVPEQHHPHAPPFELLKLVWPLVMMCFRTTYPNAPQSVGEASVPMWPVIAARAANSFIGQVSGVLDPSTALRIVMETAIFGSKVDPGAIDG